MTVQLSWNYKEVPRFTFGWIIQRVTHLCELLQIPATDPCHECANFTDCDCLWISTFLKCQGSFKTLAMMSTFSNMSIMFITTLQIRKVDPQVENTPRLVLNLSLTFDTGLVERAREREWEREEAGSEWASEKGSIRWRGGALTPRWTKVLYPGCTGSS
jgi:hypothetical protein